MSRVEQYRIRMARNADRDHEPMIRDLEAGMLQKDIAAKYDVSDKWVSYVKKRAIKRGRLSPDFKANNAGKLS